MIAVSMKNVSKCFIQQDSRLLIFGFKRFGVLWKRLRRKKIDIPSFWVIRDVSLEIPAGSIVGVVGEMGSGKTTFLKLMSRMMSPTEGEIHLSSHPSSFFQQRMFFQREFSVNEFIYFHGAIQGVGKRVISGKIKEIFKFAEVDSDKNLTLMDYSKTDLMKLIFSVIVNLNPGIVVVDDVLDSLDHDFRQKAIGKLKELSKQGSVILLSSNNLHTIRESCNRCLLLRDSAIEADGGVEEVISVFQKPVFQKQKRKEGTITKGKPVRITGLSLHDTNYGEINVIETNAPFLVRMRFSVSKRGGCTYGFRVQCMSSELFYSFQPDTENYRVVEPSVFEVFCRIPGHILADKSYTLKSFVIWHDLDSEEKLLDVSQLSFHTTPDPYFDRIKKYTINNASYPGIIAPEIRWEPLKVLFSDNESSDFEGEGCI